MLSPSSGLTCDISTSETSVSIETTTWWRNVQDHNPSNPTVKTWNVYPLLLAETRPRNAWTWKDAEGRHHGLVQSRQLPAGKAVRTTSPQADIYTRNLLNNATKWYPLGRDGRSVLSRHQTNTLLLSEQTTSSVKRNSSGQNVCCRNYSKQDTLQTSFSETDTPLSQVASVCAANLGSPCSVQVADPTASVRYGIWRARTPSSINAVPHSVLQQWLKACLPALYTTDSLPNTAYLPQ